MAKGWLAPRRRGVVGKVPAVLVALLLLGSVLYTCQAFQYFLHDDEGGYAYAAWRISQGEVPYRDFLTPQMPAFLYWGGLVVRLFGRSFVALRAATAATMLLAAVLLYATNRELFGRRVALLSMGLFLVEQRKRLGYIGLASVFFGLSILSKLFGALPLGGCFLYLLYAYRREGRSARSVLREGLALGLPALILVGAMAVLFTYLTPYFFTAVFEHHTMQGATLAAAERLRKGIDYYRAYIQSQPFAIGLAVFGAWLALRRDRALPSLLVCQAPTALLFLARSAAATPHLPGASVGYPGRAGPGLGVGEPAAGTAALEAGVGSSAGFGASPGSRFPLDG